jgi:hypothetical protein
MKTMASKKFTFNKLPSFFLILSVEVNVLECDQLLCVTFCLHIYFLYLLSFKHCIVEFKFIFLIIQVSILSVTQFSLRTSDELEASDKHLSLLRECNSRDVAV